MGKEITLYTALYNGIYGVMKYEHLMTPEEQPELKAIEAMAKDAKKRRAQFMARLRQRAWRLRKEGKE